VDGGLGVASQRRMVGGGGIWEHCLRVKVFGLPVDGLEA